MIKIDKIAFNNAYTSLVMLQVQTQKATDTLLDQVVWHIEEDKNAIRQWITA